LKSFTQPATVLYVSQPTRTAQIKKLEDALRLLLLGGRRRMERDLLPMPERVLQDLDTVLLDVQDLVAVAPRCSADRRAALSGRQPPDAIKQFRKVPLGVSFVLKDVIARWRPCSATATK
jgi:DNA-binding transcriptional LysR family regulator